MENFLVQTFTIANHPVMRLKREFKEQYVRGVGECLCRLTRNDAATKMVFEVWCVSILGFNLPGAFAYSDSYESVRNALSFHRSGFAFITMRSAFLFDCFYLLEKSQQNIRSGAYSFLLERAHGYFVRKKLDYTYAFFEGRNNGKQIPAVLLSHRQRALSFANSKVKRVLIVATMSAGKSTLVNALVGHKVSQVRATACTSIVHRIYNKPVAEGAVASLGRDGFLYTDDYSQLVSESVEAIGVNFSTQLSKARICLLDTPGVNYYGDKSHGELTRKMIQENEYDVLVLVLNAQQLAIEDEWGLIDFVSKNCRRKVIGVLNQCDVFKASEDSIEEALKCGRGMMSQAGIQHPVVIPVSAQAAFLSRQAAELGDTMDEEDAFEYRRMAKKMAKPYYDLLSYLPDASKRMKTTSLIERSGVPFLERALLNA